MELIRFSTLTALDISNCEEVIVAIGALETKSPLGMSDPVTKTSSTTIASSNSSASVSGTSCADTRVLLREKDIVSRKKSRRARRI